MPVEAIGIHRAPKIDLVWLQILLSVFGTVNGEWTDLDAYSRSKTAAASAINAHLNYWFNSHERNYLAMIESAQLQFIPLISLSNLSGIATKERWLR